MAHAFRALAKSPSFTFSAIALVATGIGMNTAVFTLTARILLERVPVHNSHELVELGSFDTHRGRFSNELSYPAFRLFSSQKDLISGLCGFSDPIEANIVSAGTPGLARAVFETANYAQVLGLHAALGRLFNDADSTASGESPPAVLNYDYWRQRFASDPRVIGMTITVNSIPFVVVGVMPRSFRGMTLGVREDIALPVRTVDDVRGLPTLNNAGNWWLHIVARRRDSATLLQIRAALTPAYASAIDMLLAAWPPALAGSMSKFTSAQRFDVRPAALGTDSSTRDQLERPLQVLMMITAVVFLITCANLAGLMLARAAARTRDIGIRLAIGCTRGRLVREMLAENLLLAALGGAAGIATAVRTGPALLPLLAGERTSQVINGHPDTIALLAGIILAVLAGIAPGLLPAIIASRLDPQDSIRQGSRPVVSAKSTLGRMLIVAQMATSLVLLAGACQFVATLRNYRNLDPGYRADHVLLAQVNPGSVKYSSAQKIAYTRRVREALANIPGVQSVTFSTSAMGQTSWTTAVKIAGFQSTAPLGDSTSRNIVGPRFIETLGLTLLLGRDFDTRDTRDAAPAVVVNQAFARHFFGKDDVIGRPVFFIDSMNRAHTIIGVVKDARDRSLKSAPGPAAYTSYEHDPLGNITLALRTSRDRADLLNDVSRVLHSVDPGVPVGLTRTLRMDVDDSLLREKMMATLSVLFGAVAILVASMGLYGLLAWATAGRTREIGVRIAVGARPVQVEWLAIKDTLWIFLIGVVVGIPAYLAFSRLIRTQIFGVTPADPRILLAAVAILLIAALSAAIIPARRAGVINPIDALRQD
ncbi:MAG TPA: ADOP family duplicated permease [Bryobacteraceae bacterium]|jgi:predicted permease